MPFALAIISYWILVYLVKSTTYPHESEPSKPFPKKWDTGHELTIFLSVDFWFANVFKNRIKQFLPREVARVKLKSYIQLNNQVNVLISAGIFLLLVCIYHLDRGSVAYETLLVLSVIRYISRSYEIGFAFGRDVLQSKIQSSGLNKYERIRLALFSYLEVFIFSAAAYLALPSITDPMDALSTSLNVGTLTNVGVAFGPGSTFFSNMVFIQVICTLSLVVLSLASYLSRAK